MNEEPTLYYGLIVQRIAGIVSSHAMMQGDTITLCGIVPYEGRPHIFGPTRRFAANKLVDQVTCSTCQELLPLPQRAISLSVFTLQYEYFDTCDRELALQLAKNVVLSDSDEKVVVLQHKDRYFLYTTERARVGLTLPGVILVTDNEI